MSICICPSLFQGFAVKFKCVFLDEEFVLHGWRVRAVALDLAGPWRALRDQVMALAEGTARRIRAGAKYQFSDDPTRLRDYKGFTEPRARKKAAAAATPTPAQP